MVREWKLRTEPVPVDQEHSFLLGSFPHAFGEAGPAEENIAFDPGILMPINPLAIFLSLISKETHADSRRMLPNTKGH